MKSLLQVLDGGLTEVSVEPKTAVEVQDRSARMMSIVESWIAAINENDWETAFSFYHPQVVFQLPNGESVFQETSKFQGHDEMKTLLQTAKEKIDRTIYSNNRMYVHNETVIVESDMSLRLRHDKSWIKRHVMQKFVFDGDLIVDRTFIADYQQLHDAGICISNS